MQAIERQTIVTWYKPSERLPKEGNIVVATISGHTGNVTYDHAFALVSYFDDGSGWMIEDYIIDDFIIHAWCDLDPYGGKEAYENKRNTEKR